MNNIYFIGGSPCAGKSTIAQIISEKYELSYFKVDDQLDRYMEMAAQKGTSICRKLTGLSAEQIWMREPQLQCFEEFQYYREVFEYVLDDLNQMNCKNGIITEGAAYVPELINKLGIEQNRYISITPTPEFQIFHFRKRDFVPYVLNGCKDFEKAFCNWMERDIFFAKEVQHQCLRYGYASIINNGKIKLEELVKQIETHFNIR